MIMARKGITPVIAIIVLLLITVALSTAAWSYLSGYMGTLTSRSVELIDYFCVAGDTGVIIIGNMGSAPVPVGEITIVDQDTGNTVEGYWSLPSQTPTTTDLITEIDISSQAKWTEDTTGGGVCTTACTLRIVTGSTRAQTARIVCP